MCGHARVLTNTRVLANTHTTKTIVFRTTKLLPLMSVGTIGLVSGRFLYRINRMVPSDMDITNCSRCLYLCGVRLFWYMAAIHFHTVQLWRDVHYSNVRSVLNDCQFRALFCVGAWTLLPTSGVSKHVRVPREPSFTVAITVQSRTLAAVHVIQ